MAKRKRFFRRRGRRRFRKFRRHGRSFKKKRLFRQVKRKIIKKKFRRRKKRLVRTIEHVINHDTPCGTYKHLGHVTLMNPNNKRSYAQVDVAQRDLNFGSPQDLLYIVSTLFNNLPPKLLGYKFGNLNLMLDLQGLKFQIINHYVGWCARNCDRVPVVLTHYEFIPTMNGTYMTSLTPITAPLQETFIMDPLNAWAASYSSMFGVYLDADSASPTTFRTVPTQAAIQSVGFYTDFIQSFMTEPGDVSKVLKKYFRVRRKEYRLLPGQCRVLPKTNRIKNKEIVYPGAALDYTLVPVANFVDRKHGLHSSWHVWMHRPEAEWQSSTSPADKIPDASTDRTTFVGVFPSSNVIYPGSGKFKSSAATNGVIISYFQKCRLRAPRNTPIANEKESFVYVSGVQQAVINTNLKVDDYAVMSGSNNPAG